MFDELLFPTDGSDAAAAAFEQVLDIAAEHGSTVHVLNVADTNRDSVTSLRGDVVDVVILGMHGRTGFDRYVLGSVAEKLVRTSSVPC